MSKKRGIDNSGGGQAWVTSDKWGPLKDQLLHLSYGQSKMYVVLKEEKHGQMQGGVARIPVELSSSAMRARINPRDGQLYVSGLKGWQTNAKGNGGLDRIRYTGKPVHLPKSIKVKKDVVEIGFYEALDPEAANSVSQFKFGAWNLKWSFNYGSPEIPVKELELKKVELLDDGKTVALHIPNLKPVHMAQIDYDIKSANGEEIKGRIDHTIHVVEQCVRNFDMKVVLWLTVLFSVFIGYIQAEKTELAYRIISPVEHQVIQRDSGNTAWVELKDVTASPVSKSGLLEYRLDKNKTWEKLSGEWKNQNHLSRLKMPAGGWYGLEVRDSRTPDHRSQVVQFGVGEVFVVAGQSNSGNYGEVKQSTQTGLVSAYDF